MKSDVIFRVHLFGNVRKTNLQLETAVETVLGENIQADSVSVHVPQTGKKLTANELRQEILKMADDTDGDVRAIGNALLQYADGASNTELFDVTQSTLDAFIEICLQLRNQL